MSVRRLVAFLCIALLLFAALAPGASALSVAILTAFFVFLAILLAVAIHPATEDRAVPVVHCLSPVASRAP
jgi:predicted anti-sigma-YlaC factor YlaD